MADPLRLFDPEQPLEGDADPVAQWLDWEETANLVGFRTSTQPLKLHQEHDMDFVAVCVLDMLSDFPNPTPTQTIVDECAKDKVASAATTHRKLGTLKAMGLVSEHLHPEDKDGRKCYIKITDTGMKLLNEWEGK